MLSSAVIGRNLIRNPANVASSIVCMQVDAKPISSMVSDVRVKKISPPLTEYTVLSLGNELTNPSTFKGSSMFR